MPCLSTAQVVLLTKHSLSCVCSHFALVSDKGSGKWLWYFHIRWTLKFSTVRVENEDVLSENELHKRVSQTCGVSFSSIQRTVQDSDKKTDCWQIFSTSWKKRPCEKVTAYMNNFDFTIWCTVNEFNTSKKMQAMLKRILRLLKTKTTLLVLLSLCIKFFHDLGFKWKVAINNWKILTKKSKIRNPRLASLRNINMYRQHGKPII